MRIGAIVVALLVLQSLAAAQVLYPQGTPTSRPAPVIKEGTFIFRQAGTFVRSTDGRSWIFAPESEGETTLPSTPAKVPLVILPNQQLSVIEQRIKEAGPTAKFVVTGMVTQYTNRDGTAGNGLLIESAAPGEPVLAAEKIEPTAPAAPAGNLPPEKMLDRMLKPTTASSARPLRPTSAPSKDSTSGTATVAPGASILTVMREGSFLVDRTGRLTRAADGQSWEFTFDADARAMKDAPVVILPNLKLMAMEQAVKGSNRDLRFRITGMVTEYNGRNYVLLEKVLVVPDVVQQF